VVQSLPNLITVGRIVVVPVVIWAITSGNMMLAFWLFVAAGISDAVDGFLAKRFNAQTEFGAYLDPLADKLLVVSIYIALGVARELPSWLVIMVVSRDILIVIGVVLIWMIGQHVAIRPLAISKWNTAAQLLLASVVLADGGFQLGLDGVRWVLVWITGTTTLLSLAAYAREWLGLMGSSSPPGQSPTA